MAKWLLGLFFSSVVALGETGALKDWVPNDVHNYADAAACENGGGESKYLPKGISPRSAEAKDVPRTWNGKTITWDRKNHRWLVGGRPTRAGRCSSTQHATRAACLAAGENWTAGYPEVETTVTDAHRPDGSDLKCDRVEHVNPTCIPKGKLYQKDVDGIRWSVIFRRQGADRYSGPVPDIRDSADASPQWGEFHEMVFPNIDVVGFNLSTGGSTWLDVLSNGGSGPGKVPSLGQHNRYWLSFVNDPAYRIPGNDGTIPRPGGLRPWTRDEGVHAAQWWDTVRDLRRGACFKCHSGPFNGTDSLAKTGHSLGTYDDIPYWHAGNRVLAFPESQFFSGASHETTGADATACTNCHSYFMQVPGSLYNSYIDHMTGQLGGWASNWRRHADQTKPELKDPRRTHAMPKGHGATVTGVGVCSNPLLKSYLRCVEAGRTWTVKAGPGIDPKSTWVGQFQAAKEMIQCCTTATPAMGCSKVKCEGLTAAPIPDFFTPEDKYRKEAQGAWPPHGGDPSKYVYIKEPDPPENVALSVVDCPEPKPQGFGPGDKCFELRWEDSNGSPFDAAREFYWSVPSVKPIQAPDWTAAEKESWKFCPGSVSPPRTTETQLTTAPKGNRWRFTYTSVGLLRKCTKMAVQFCGGWCGEARTSYGKPAKGKGILLTLSHPAPPAGCLTPTPRP